MQAIPLLIALLFAAPVDAGEYKNKIGIALALNAEAPQEQSVVKAPATPITRLEGHLKNPPKFTTRQETRTKRVWEKISCNRYGCKWGWVNRKYTVTVKVPVESAAKTNWPNYPTSPRQNPWTQGGRHVTWRHLTSGDHAGKFSSAWLQTLSQSEVEQLHADDHENKVKWAYVVRP